MQEGMSINFLTNKFGSYFITGKKQIESQQLELTKLREELRMYRLPVREGDDTSMVVLGVRPVCEKKLVQELLLEREELFEAIKRQQSMVAEGNRLETESYYQVKIFLGAYFLVISLCFGFGVKEALGWGYCMHARDANRASHVFLLSISYIR